MPLRWTLLNDTGGQITVTCEPYGNLDALLGHIRDGVVNATELAEMLGVHAGTVSKWARKLMNAGLVRKKGREYEAVEERRMAGYGMGLD
jgi:Mn-dependent DtxR family transcriptional regulator